MWLGAEAVTKLPMSPSAQKRTLARNKLDVLLCTNSGHRGDKGSGATRTPFCRCAAQGRRMPHLALTSPLGEFYLAYELGIIHLRSRPSLAGDQRDYAACCASRSISCLHQLPIETLMAHEKIRRSVLDDPAGLQDNDTIEAPDGRKPVRDGDHGAPAHQPR